MASDTLKFKISSALKDIIGRDLITDDFIAVFELVKNSYDAHATRVDITFEGVGTKKSKIIITDNGKGMNYNDILNKWLFVAYSAKKEGTEDDSFDYRNNLHSKKVFAGAKGIGRFSCDRLGKTLFLETTKLEENRQTQVLFTEWENFENDLKAEFVDINVIHDTKQSSDFGLDHGTVLIIEDLRSDWNRSKFLKLKDSLAKLINPNSGKQGTNFKIFLHVEEEKERDQNLDEDRKKVNGEIKNFIFKTLGLKTTRIISSIVDNGKFIESELIDGGTLIYKIKEINTYKLLHKIDLTLFFLNRSAKMIFTKRMGISSNQYGHIFLYKNGFRVYPYGEPGEDPLKIDLRKAQGHSRYLGTRDLIGQIDIEEQNEALKETSSRGDGLIKTDAYYELEDFFKLTLRRLEKYVVEVQKWGFSVEDESDDKQIETRITELIAKLSGSENIVDFGYSEDFLSILKRSQSQSVDTIVKNLNQLAIKSKDEKIISQTQKASNLLKEIQLARKDAEEEADKQREIAQSTTNNLVEKETENLFLKSIKSQDFDEVVSFLHHIGISSKNIDNNLKLLVKKIKKGKEFTNEELIANLQKVMFENRKILSISKFASKANFKLFTSEIEINIVEYVTEYINNVLGLSVNQKPRVLIKKNQEIEFKRNLKPIEINIIIDNLLSNSRRAQAENVYINFSKENNKLNIHFTDDGRGIKKENSNKIFDFGYTTTSGSGIGLFHINKMLTEMNGSISYNEDRKELTEFVITLE